MRDALGSRAAVPQLRADQPPRPPSRLADGATAPVRRGKTARPGLHVEKKHEIVRAMLEYL